MTDATELRALLEKVEAKRAKHTARLWIGPDAEALHWNPEIVVRAYNGSLDAAGTLHTVLTPDYKWSLYQEDNMEFLCVLSLSSDSKIYEEVWSANPARAWLIAIIRARIAALETNSGQTA